MTSPSEQYFESLQRGQQAVFQAMEAWSENAQKAFNAPTPGPSAVSPDQVIDQVFDFAEQILKMQRRFAKQVMSAAAAAAKGSSPS